MIRCSIDSTRCKGGEGRVNEEEEEKEEENEEDEQDDEDEDGLTSGKSFIGAPVVT